MGVRFTGDWKKALEFSKRAQAGIEEALKAEADELAEKMRDGLASGSPAGTVLAPLHPLTAALKGSTIPLAGMERWVVSVPLSRFKYFIGFRDPFAVRIGAIHEEGRSWTQVWTAKQRAWFFAQMSRFGLLDPNRPPNPSGTPGEIHITIPARPWLQPIVDAYLPGAKERIRTVVLNAILR